MRSVIQSIVDTYVRFSNRKALEDLSAHRWGLLAGLKARAGLPYDPNNTIAQSIAQLEDDLALIEAGLAKLNTAAA